MVTQRTSVLGEVGDLAAPPGSREWAVAVSLKVQSALQDAQSDAEKLAEWVTLMREHEGYRVLKDRRGRPFTTYDAYCVERYPFGLGCRRPEEIDHIIGERKDRAARERSRTAAMATDGKVLPPHRPKSKGEEPEVGNLPTSSQSERATKNGVSHRTQRKLDRLARDFPEQHARVVAGELSVNGACIEAGFVKPTISLPLDPSAAVRVIVHRFPGPDLEALIRGLARHAGLDLVEPR